MDHKSTPAGFGALIIGDEMLSGKRTDRHMAELINFLDSRGLELDWSSYVGDQPERLTRTLAQTMKQDDVVFSFGGIGGTPDDRTRQCAAAAADLAIEEHPAGLELIRSQFGDELTPERRRMIQFPVGASLIPNPVNQVPGFSLGHHHFVPGFPNMAWPMVEWVLDHHYGHLHAAGERKERTITVYGLRESHAIPMMEAFMADYPDVRLSCLPRWRPPDYELEFGVRGPCKHVDEAVARLQSQLGQSGYKWESND